MLAIESIKCIYDTGSRAWSIELKLDAEGELAKRRFMVNGADDAETLIEAFEDSSAAAFDPETGEIVFSYEYEYGYEDEEDEEEEEDAEDEESDEEDEEPEEKPKNGGKDKGKGSK